MALSVGLGFSYAKTASLANSSSLRLSYPCVLPSHANMSTVRTLTIAAAASKPATDINNREPRGITKPRRVSPEMQEFLGGISEIPRTQSLKLIWAYIKQHNLQDPENRKIIVCDEKLKKIFGGRDRVGFLEIAGLISPHFLK